MSKHGKGHVIFIASQYVHWLVSTCDGMLEHSFTINSAIIYKGGWDAPIGGFGCCDFLKKAPHWYTFILDQARPSQIHQW